ncbi:MAG: DAK2 domain-containing protein [Oscillospiraceae bacterium]|nr:DAK2 domain-containing protein [Oscillospiraceae bacterium]
MISSLEFKDALLSGANNIFKNRIHINDLNIFPVPDGDTGTNMSMTISGAVEKIKNLDCLEKNIGEIARIAASAALRSARGNSGVILSLILKGFAQYLNGFESATEEDMIEALGLGVKNAYSAVAKPTEGTMLTVARVAYEKGSQNYSKNLEVLDEKTNIVDEVKDSISKKIKDVKEHFNKNFNIEESKDYKISVWELACIGARETLAQTPDLLPVLKRAGVVDSGGKGLCLIFEGMLSVFKNKVIIDPELKLLNIENSEEDRDFEEKIKVFDENINFTYCTEFIVLKSVISNFNLKKFQKFLDKIGDSIVVVEDQEIVKVHVHTNLPDQALNKGLKIGHLIAIKITNMEEQRNEKLELNRAENQSKKIENSKKIIKVVKPIKKFGIVAIADGQGLAEAFKQLGCDAIIYGGQTMNPSAEEIAIAAKTVLADVIYVLPNNKNIIMAAQQASELINDKNLLVIKSRTIPQGLTALLAFDPNSSVKENTLAMSLALKKVDTGQVTFASRDAEFNGFKIKKGDILALNNGKLVFLETDPMIAAMNLIKSMSKFASFITLIYGDKITSDKAMELKSTIVKEFPDIEVSLINGGGEVYYFTVSIE